MVAPVIEGDKPWRRSSGASADFSDGVRPSRRQRAEIEAHMRSDHPELVGKVTREDLIAMAEEA